MIALTNAEIVAAMTGRRGSAVPRVEQGVRFAFYRVAHSWWATTTSTASTSAVITTGVA